MTASATITFGVVNAAGRAGLTEWLRSNLKHPENAERHAAAAVDGLDGSFAEVQGLSYELRGFYSASGNPAIYSFDRSEYDLITTDEDGNEIERR